ncbi:MAG: thiamine-phosphate pyrophosphorylase [Pseudomonadota bacterium]|nr:thiamine-phosphate pyrophosphorylase [Pseudomonadota bacterium]
MKWPDANVLRGLYVITDEQRIAQNRFAETVEQVLRGGARIIQYRDKSADRTKRLAQAKTLKMLCEKYQSALIINDDTELALQIDADGVHIGQHDASLADARRQLGRHKIIGVSCYNNFSLAQSAAQHGANYIAFGSFFPSTTKPDAVRAETALLARARQELNIPVCAIGGITLDNASALIRHGADMIAVINDVFGNNDTESRCRNLSALFNS